MRSPLSLLIAVMPLAFGLSPAARADAPSFRGRVDTLATFAGGPSLQSIDRAPDGTLYLTDYAHDLLLKVSRKGDATTFVPSLPVHPQGIMVTKTGFLVTGHVNRPSSDKSLSLTQRFQNLDGRLLVLDRQGKILKNIALGANTFPNGMTRLNAKYILIADSLAGAVWKADPKAGTITAWTQDPLVRPEPAFPGANGVKVHNGWVYISNTAKNEIVRLKLSGSGEPEGSATVFSKAPHVDELTIARNGTIYAASHAAMLKISPAGEQTNVFETVAGGSALMLAPDQKSIFVTTDAVTSNGVKGPGYVLRIWLNR